MNKFDGKVYWALGILAGLSIATHCTQLFFAKKKEDVCNPKRQMIGMAIGLSLFLHCFDLLKDKLK